MQDDYTKHNQTPQTQWTPERIAAVSRNAALVLIGGVAIGIFAAAANLYYVGVIVAAAILVMLVSWRFEVTLAIYAIVAFIPWGRTPDLAVGGSGVGKGVYISEVMLGFLLMVWFGKYLFGSLPKNRIKSGFYVPVGLYLAYSIVNVVNSFIFWDPHVNKMYQHPSVNVIELGLRFLSAGALVMMATSVSSRKWLRWTTIAVMIPGMYNLFNGLTGNIIPFSAPWWPLITLLPVGFCLAVVIDPSFSLLKRILSAFVIAVAVFVILVKGISWISGWFGLFVTLATVAFIKNRRLFIVGTVVTLVIAAASWGFFNEKVVTASQEEGDYDRFALLRGGLKYATHFPLGVGLGNYRTYNSFYYGQEWGTTSYTSAHGAYSQHLSETGIPGCVLFLSILICGFRWMHSRYWKLRDRFSRVFMLAAMGQLAGIACAAFIGDYIIPTYHNGGLTTFSTTVYSWIIWGLAVAHVRLNQEEDYGSIDINS